ncbi:hypothetical protein BH23CHL9_BH23CHL9_13960 [soil metagenome]
MEAALLIIGFVGFVSAAYRYGVDSRPRLDDEPQRAI